MNIDNQADYKENSNGGTGEGFLMFVVGSVLRAVGSKPRDFARSAGGRLTERPMLRGHTLE